MNDNFENEQNIFFERLKTNEPDGFVHERLTNEMKKADRANLYQLAHGTH